jgi:hypothetical protein
MLELQHFSRNTCCSLDFIAIVITFSIFLSHDRAPVLFIFEGVSELFSASYTKPKKMPSPYNLVKFKKATTLVKAPA